MIFKTIELFNRIFKKPINNLKLEHNKNDLWLSFYLNSFEINGNINQQKLDNFFSSVILFTGVLSPSLSLEYFPFNSIAFTTDSQSAIRIIL